MNYSWTSHSPLRRIHDRARRSPSHHPTPCPLQSSTWSLPETPLTCSSGCHCWQGGWRTVCAHSRIFKASLRRQDVLEKFRAVWYLKNIKLKAKKTPTSLPNIDIRAPLSSVINWWGCSKKHQAHLGLNSGFLHYFFTISSLLMTWFACLQTVLWMYLSQAWDTSYSCAVQDLMLDRIGKCSWDMCRKSRGKGHLLILMLVWMCVWCWCTWSSVCLQAVKALTTQIWAGLLVLADLPGIKALYLILLKSWWV